MFYRVVHNYVLYMSFMGDKISSDQIVINLIHDLNVEFFKEKRVWPKLKKLETSIYFF